MKKERIDLLLVENGFFESRTQAQAAIMEGRVHTSNERIDKPGTKINRETEIFVKGNNNPYVSRGGYKLEKAINEFNLDLKNKIVADIGSSTGGFTDCALQNGARLVYAIDVGTNQLVWKLRTDNRVVVLEKTNFRYATKELFIQGIPNFVTIDVSFISLNLIFQPLKNILTDNTKVMALIKPQFEAGKDEVGKKGIVSNKETHLSVIKKVIQFGVENDLYIQNISHSPITGGDGNIEFITVFEKNGKSIELDLESVVNKAHQNFER